MPTVNSDGVPLAVDVVGHGEPVTVVAHGLTGSRGDFALLAPFMPGTTIPFDFRGHGHSGRPPPGAYTMDHFAADVDSVAAAFGATAVVGVSLGGGATLRLLTRRPDRFDRLVFFLPARLERSDAAHGKLLRLAGLLGVPSGDRGGGHPPGRGGDPGHVRWPSGGPGSAPDLDPVHESRRHPWSHPRVHRRSTDPVRGQAP